MNKFNALSIHKNDIIERYQEGASKKSLSKDYNVGIRLIKRLLEQEEIPNNLIRYGDEKKKKALELARNGCNDVEISIETGISLYLANQYVNIVKKEIKETYENSKLIKAKDLRKIRTCVVEGKKYSDITDFYAGV
ncbi:MAG: hypothetical protein BV456_03595 [Thermoplasmata archaeon M8B2D]|nr:MAG: hypothetical protein BV456_03595 [Thermoplasmata archaeon M8B2D]